jgi:hypothetical protein
MEEIIIQATVNALKSLTPERFFQTERGYQGRFYCNLQKELDDAKILNDQTILEMEYQKSARHGISQRPDIVLHIPAEASGAKRDENNFAVFALKRKASETDADDDFQKLNEMFNHLKYPLGIFINISSDRVLTEIYYGDYPERIHSFAVWLENGSVNINYSFWNGETFEKVRLLIMKSIILN